MLIIQLGQKKVMTKMNGIIGKTTLTIDTLSKFSYLQKQSYFGFEYDLFIDENSDGIVDFFYYNGKSFDKDKNTQAYSEVFQKANVDFQKQLNRFNLE